MTAAGRCATACLTLLAAACGDPTPHLTAMRDHLKADPRRGEFCARAALLTTQAHELFKTHTDLVAVTHILLKRYDQPGFTVGERTRLETLLLGQAGLAQAFQGLTPDTLTIASLQICRVQFDGGRTDLSGPAWLKRLDTAERCESGFPAGERRKECVASAFAQF